INHCKIVKPHNRVTVKLYMQINDLTIAQIHPFTYYYIALQIVNLNVNIHVNLS
ncbi:hypothetical protein LX74_01297, partial [Elizabethkingia miricola]